MPRHTIDPGIDKAVASPGGELDVGSVLSGVTPAPTRTSLPAGARTVRDIHIQELRTRVTATVPRTRFTALEEIGDPDAPETNYARLYVKDNGSGKTNLVVRFATGAVQSVALEP